MTTHTPPPGVAAAMRYLLARRATHKLNTPCPILFKGPGYAGVLKKILTRNTDPKNK